MSMVILKHSVSDQHIVCTAELYQPFTSSFCSPRPNFPQIVFGVTILPTLAFKSPMMNLTSRLGIVFRVSCRIS